MVKTIKEEDKSERQAPETELLQAPPSSATGGSVKAEGLGDGPTHGTVALLDDSTLALEKRPFLLSTDAGIIYTMKSLLKSNPYLADPVYRKAMLYDNARQSSILEGARGIPAQPAGRSRKRRSKASTKKAGKGS